MARRLSRGHVVMYLAQAGGHRGRAALLAGVSRSAFQRAMRRYGIRAPRSDAKLGPWDLRIARRLVADGLTWRTVARKLEVHHVTLLRRR